MLACEDVREEFAAKVGASLAKALMEGEHHTADALVRRYPWAADHSFGGHHCLCWAACDPGGVEFISFVAEKNPAALVAHGESAAAWAVEHGNHEAVDLLNSLGVRMSPSLLFICADAADARTMSSLVDAGLDHWNGWPPGHSPRDRILHVLQGGRVGFDRPFPVALSLERIESATKWLARADSTVLFRSLAEASRDSGGKSAESL